LTPCRVRLSTRVGESRHEHIGVFWNQFAAPRASIKLRGCPLPRVIEHGARPASANPAYHEHSSSGFASGGSAATKAIDPNNEGSTLKNETSLGLANSAAKVAPSGCFRQRSPSWSTRRRVPSPGSPTRPRRQKHSARRGAPARRAGRPRRVPPAATLRSRAMLGGEGRGVDHCVARLSQYMSRFVAVLYKPLIPRR